MKQRRLIHYCSTLRPRLIRPQILLAVGVLSGALTGCSHSPVGKNPSESKSGSEVKLIHVEGGSGVEISSEGLRLAGITTVTAGVAEVGKNLQPTGEVAPTDTGTIQITSRLSGKVVQAYVSAGDRVRKGQLVATVDSVDLTQAEATYQTARAHAALTFNQLNQQKRLAKFGTLSEPQLEDARRSNAAAQAALNSDLEQIKVDKIALENTKQLLSLGEITHKPVEDAQNAHAAARGALTQAKVTLQSAKQSFERTKILYEGGIYSKQQFEDAQTAYNNAVAAVEQDTIQEKTAADELARQQKVFEQNLNGASALQQAQSKLQQDQHTYQNDLTATQLAKRALERAQTVQKSGIPINQALQQAQDTYDEAVVALRGAENTLKLYGVAPGQVLAQMGNGHVIVPVTSPIDGIVTARNMLAGQLVDTSTALAKVVNLDQVFVDAQLYEKDLTSVSVGDPIRLNVAAFPNRMFTGKVMYVGREVNPDTRTILVRTVVRNPGWMLRPGMFATVNIGGKLGGRTVAIPSDAILQHGSAQVVYVQVSPNQFVQRKVDVGPASEGRVPIRSGLTGGDRVVVTGNLLLEAEQEKLESESRKTT